MMTYNEAVQILQETMRAYKLETEKVALSDAVGRICAEDLLAGLDIQPFNNSAMDGFAVQLDDLSMASSANPVQLRKAGVIAAGLPPEGAILEKGDCWHVMTGATLPTGAQAVIPVENVAIEGRFVAFGKVPVLGQNIRHAGEDFKKGTLVLSKGIRILTAHILPLATLGMAEITVFKKPKILFLPTGTEIVDDLTADLQTGQIYNSNKFYSIAFLKAAGADVTAYETICDDSAVFMEALKKAQNEKYDLIISSGAVSAGSFDFVRAGLEKSGSEILYHKIGLKPGKPNLLAKLPAGALYFGLPGNPVATAVGLRFFVSEALRLLSMQKPEKTIFARAENGFLKKSGLHMILKGCLRSQEDGTMAVQILDGQESFKVNPFLTMNCWVHLEEGQEEIAVGDVVKAYPLQA